MATDYSKLKVTELRELLKERGIASTGLTRKQQIVDALEAKDGEVSGAGGDDDAGEAEHGSGGEDRADGAAAATGDGGDGGHEGNGADEAEAVGETEANGGIEAEKVEAALEGVDEAVEETLPTTTKDAQPEEGATPIVLEADQPVSQEPSHLETPRHSSPPLQDASSETRKRKRRSPTPPLSSASVSKKLKSAEDETATLPEDSVVEDAPVPLGGAADAAMEDAPRKVQPYASSDDVMDVQEDVAMSDVPANSGAGAASDSMEASAPATDAPEEATSTPSPALHPATRALYIRDLIRPLQPAQLRDHLLTVATPPSEARDDSLLTAFHLDTLRTHALVLFTTPAAASRARAQLHATVWPAEPTRKPLWVDYVPDETVEGWIDAEVSAGSSRRDAKKWEVAYRSADGGGMTAVHQEIPSAPSGFGGSRQQSIGGNNGAALGMPNAPLGPRSQRPAQTGFPALTTAAPTQPRHLEAHDREQHPPQHELTAKPTPTPTAAAPNTSTTSPSTSTTTLLDQTFHSTTQKPKLYFLPQPTSVADQRLDALDALTARDWGNVRREAGVWREGELRRFTFEEGGRVVDGGVDRGSFGLPEGARRGRGGRGGGRYGGGGGRFGGGGDRYGGGGRYRGGR
ncbi:hypothetical protein LTR36_008071 [Oleoguttula mirabilis]|uniref:SAP domain-containing protein n=1 Tax=Oleoguttula mirabilis TaxID=1507867 RepID=A0AAV9J8N6_9PEZI|nr:hypothetical protein LTR36_008071 [Oleoguttula mirabilis]